MKTNRIIATAIAAATLSIAAQAPAGATAGSDTLYGQLAELADQLHSISWPTEWPNDTEDQWDYNFYPGAKDRPDTATTVTWGTPGQPTTYRSIAKCAALLTAALEHSFSWASESYLQQQFLPSHPTTPSPGVSPTAADYYDGFVANQGSDHFSAKSTVPALAPGDIIAIKYPAGSTDTGHVMVVAAAPSPTKNTNEWAVRVIDSTSNPHGVASVLSSSSYLAYPDTRARDTTEFSGIGRGWIIVNTDAAGVPTGYRWGVNESTTYPVSARPMVFEAVL